MSIFPPPTLVVDGVDWTTTGVLLPDWSATSRLKYCYYLTGLVLDWTTVVLLHWTTTRICCWELVLLLLHGTTTLLEIAILLNIRAYRLRF